MDNNIKKVLETTKTTEVNVLDKAEWVLPSLKNNEDFLNGGFGRYTIDDLKNYNLAIGPSDTLWASSFCNSSTIKPILQPIKPSHSVSVYADNSKSNKIIYIRKVLDNKLIDIAYNAQSAQSIVDKAAEEITSEDKKTLENLGIASDDYFYFEYVDTNKKFLISLKNDKAEGLVPFTIINSEEDARSICEFKNKSAMKGNIWVYNELDCL